MVVIHFPLGPLQELFSHSFLTRFTVLGVDILWSGPQIQLGSGWLPPNSHVTITPMSTSCPAPGGVIHRLHSWVRPLMPLVTPLAS